MCLLYKKEKKNYVYLVTQYFNENQNVKLSVERVWSF